MDLKAVKATNLLTYLTEARKLNLKIEILASNLAKISNKTTSCYFFLARTPLNSFVSANLSVNKALTSLLLDKGNILINQACPVLTEVQALKQADKIGYPLVLKPITGKQGQKVFVKIKTRQELTSLLRTYKKELLQGRFVLSKHLQGKEYRLLVLDGKIIGAVKRTPAFVIGDGQNTIEYLTTKLNRQKEKKNKSLGLATFSPVKISPVLKTVLTKQNYSLTSIPKKGKKVFLSFTANRSQGGFTTALTNIKDRFHPLILKNCLKSLKALGLKFAAVDFIVKNPLKPFSLTNGMILELNASPGINLHHYPDAGKPQPVAKIVLEYIFGRN